MAYKYQIFADLLPELTKAELKSIDVVAAVTKGLNNGRCI